MTMEELGKAEATDTITYTDDFSSFYETFLETKIKKNTLNTLNILKRYFYYFLFVLNNKAKNQIMKIKS